MQIWFSGIFAKEAAGVAFVDDDEILRVMRGYNPWWLAGAIPAEAVKTVRRMAFHEVADWLWRRRVQRAVLLTGARRVGKTTILYQLIADALSQGFPARHILLLSLDHPVFKLTTLEKIVEMFEVNISEANETALLLLDEIQYAQDWDRYLKILVDRRPGYKIVATGSASAVLRGRGTESGVGRWVEIRMPTLSFYEYVLLKGLPRPDIPAGLKPSHLPKLPPAQAQEIVEKCAPLLPLFHRYLLHGGFPETALMEDTAAAQRLLREDVVDKVLKRDIVALYNIRNVLELERLFIYLCLHSGGIVVKDTLARELRVSRPTVEKDLELLEASHLIYRLNPLPAAGKRALKPLTKVYVADPALRNAVLVRADEVLTDPDQMGMIVETAVLKHLLTFYYPEQPRLGYWRDSRAGDEVDLVLTLPSGSHVAVEVKYRERVSAADARGLLAFCAAVEVAGAFLVTKGRADVGPLDAPHLPAGRTGPWRIPAYAFLYLLGHAEHERATGRSG